MHAQHSPVTPEHTPEKKSKTTKAIAEHSVNDFAGPMANGDIY